jgi:hypothetical protein
MILQFSTVRLFKQRAKATASDATTLNLAGLSPPYLPALPGPAGAISHSASLFVGPEAPSQRWKLAVPVSTADNPHDYDSTQNSPSTTNFCWVQY